MTIGLEQRGDDFASAWLSQAATLDIEVTWTVTGQGGVTGGVATIPQGRRTSDEFGASMTSAANIQLSTPRFPGVSELPDDLDPALGRIGIGNDSGFELAIASASTPGVVFHPARLTVPENGMATSIVVLNTALTGNVTLIPRVSPAGSDVRVLQGVPSPQTCIVRMVIPTLTLPEATGGDGALVYRLSRRGLPAGLRYTARTRTLTGSPTSAEPTVTLTWTARDTDTNQSPEDEDSLTFTMTVIEIPAEVILDQTALTVGGCLPYGTLGFLRSQE